MTTNLRDYLDDIAALTIDPPLPEDYADYTPIPDPDLEGEWNGAMAFAWDLYLFDERRRCAADRLFNPYAYGGGAQ
jgi:hypothetical protein